MTPPLLVDFAPPVSYSATTAGIYTAVQLPTLDEVRKRRRQRRACTCSDGTCNACFLRDDAEHERSQDV